MNVALIDSLPGKLVTGGEYEVETHMADYVKHPANTGITSGNAQTYNVNTSPNPTELIDKMGIMITAHVDSSANPSIRWGTHPTKAIRKPNGNFAQLKKDGLYTLRYNAVNDSFILQGEGGEYGTATAPDVLSGKTIGREEGIVAGTMPNRGSVGIQSHLTDPIDLPDGYYKSSIVFPPTAQPGEHLIWERNSFGSTIGSDVMKLMGSAPVFSKGGIFRITFYLDGHITNIAFGQIYKNGIPYGIERGANAHTVRFIEDLEFSQGSTLSFYARCQNFNGQYTYMKDMTIGVQVVKYL